VKSGEAQAGVPIADNADKRGFSRPMFNHASRVWIRRVRTNRRCWGMSKYDPLSGHLRRQRQDELELSFAEIERILGAMLPKSAARQQW